MENFVCNQYEENLTILNVEDIKICGWITKLEAFFYHIAENSNF